MADHNRDTVERRSELHLREHVAKLSVLRHGKENYEELEHVARYIETWPPHAPRSIVSAGCMLQSEAAYADRLMRGGVGRLRHHAPVGEKDQKNL